MYICLLRIPSDYHPPTVPQQLNPTRGWFPQHNTLPQCLKHETEGVPHHTQYQCSCQQQTCPSLGAQNTRRRRVYSPPTSHPLLTRNVRDGMSNMATTTHCSTTTTNMATFSSLAQNAREGIFCQPPLPCSKRMSNGIHHHSPAWPKLQTQAFVLDSGVSAPSKMLNYNIFITLHYFILFYLVFNLIKKTCCTHALGVGFRQVTSSQPILVPALPVPSTCMGL